MIWYRGSWMMKRTVCTDLPFLIKNKVVSSPTQYSISRANKFRFRRLSLNDLTFLCSMIEDTVTARKKNA